MNRVDVSIGAPQSSAPKAKKVKNAAQTEPLPPNAVKKKVRRKGGLNTGSSFDIPHDIKQALWAQGVDLCWVLDTVIGQEFSHITNTFYSDGCWEPATVDMFRGQLANRWTPVGHVGTIRHGGQVLCWRPKELSIEAQAEQLEAARAPTNTTRRNFRNRQVPGLSSAGQTPQAQAITGLNEEYARIPD